MIASAEETLRACVPDRESEIPTEMIDRRLAPRGVCVEDQVRIGRVIWNVSPCRPKRTLQIVAAVEARVSDQPRVSIEARGLFFSLRLVRRGEQCMDEAGVPVEPDAF